MLYYNIIYNPRRAGAPAKSGAKGMSCQGAVGAAGGEAPNRPGFGKMGAGQGDERGGTGAKAGIGDNVHRIEHVAIPARSPGIQIPPFQIPQIASASSQSGRKWRMRLLMGSLRSIAVIIE